jgi:hypothetical protein
VFGGICGRSAQHLRQPPIGVICGWTYCIGGICGRIGAAICGSPHRCHLRLIGTGICGPARVSVICGGTYGIGGICGRSAQHLRPARISGIRG